MTRLLNIVLVLVTLTGCVVLARQRGAHFKIRQEFDRLSREYGKLEVTNPENHFVTRVDDDDPYRFRWRIYDPPARQTVEKLITESGVHSSWSMSSTGGEALHLCRIKFEDSVAKAFVRGDGGSSTISLGNKQVSKFLQEHWNELDIEVLGSDGAVQIPADNLVRLISIRVPIELREEFLASAGKNYATSVREARPVLAVYYGTERAFLEARLDQ